MSAGYDVHDGVKVFVTFRKEPAEGETVGEVGDPSVVELWQTKPNAITTKLSSSDDPNPFSDHEDDSGYYVWPVELDMDGRWDFEWRGTGDIQQTERVAFYVERSNIVPIA